MRAILVVGLLAFLCPASAMAQGAAPPPGSAPGVADSPPAAAPPAGRGGRFGRGGGDITRAEFIERATRRAEQRFDQMDTNHDGVLSAEERRAFRAKRQRNKPQSE